MIRQAEPSEQAAVLDIDFTFQLSYVSVWVINGLGVITFVCMLDWENEDK